MFSQKIEKVNKKICDKLAHCSMSDFMDLLSNSERYKLIDENGKIEDMKSIYTTTIYYCRKLQRNNYEYEVIYDYGKKKNNGRIFAQDYGIQKITKEIRGCLLDGIYYDFDIVNCHFNILRKICEQKNIPCFNVINYINDRDNLLNQFSFDNELSRGEAKITFISILNSDFKLKKINKKKIIGDYYFKLVDEVLIIQKSLIEHYKEEYKIIKKNNNKNINGKFLNRVLCIEENEILQKVDKEFNCNIFMFDGFNKEKKDVENANDFILKLNEFTGYTWSVKDNDTTLYDDILELEKSNKLEVFKDNLKEIAFHLYDEFYSDRLYKYKGQLFLLCEYWIHHKETIKDLIFNFLMVDLNLYTKMPIIGYVKVNSFRDYKEIYDFIVTRAKIDNNFVNDIFDSSLKKLFFQNGYFDSNERKFIYQKQKNTFKIIEKKFDEKKDYKEEKKMLFEKIFKPVFTIEEERPDFEIRTKLYKNFMYQLSRALFGCIEDKNWFSLEGMRDCGKGAICDLLKKTFGDYIGTCNGETFLNNKNLSADIAKSNSYLIDYEFCRLILTNEVKQEPDAKIQLVLDGNKIKKLVSGGDFIQARKNYQDEKEFRVQSSLMYCCNDMPEINPQDTKERLKSYYFKSKFIDKDFKETKLNNFEYYEKDENLKNTFISDKNIQMAFIKMLFDAFYNYEEYPQELKDEISEDSNDDIEKFYNLFDFENDDEHKLYLKEIKQVTRENSIIFNQRRIQLLIKDKNYVKFRDRDGIHYKGIYIKECDRGFDE